MQFALGLGTLRPIPDWCSWVPFSDFMAACQPYSATEIKTDYEQNLARIKAANPALYQQTMSQYDAEAGAICRSDPSGCAEYKYYLAHPTVSKVIGTGAGVELEKLNPLDFSQPYWWVAWAAAGGIVLLLALKR